ncbi:MAG: DUF3791 domain-containing protein, partial [Bacteroidales bacterium]|nr:DUF3791 domain-containing protein [Bacteroidales bacterium]
SSFFPFVSAKITTLTFGLIFREHYITFLLRNSNKSQYFYQFRIATIEIMSIFANEIEDSRQLKTRTLMTTQLSNDTYRKVHFAVMAIEASAKKEKISGKRMHDRLKLQDLIHKRLFRYYDQLHTQSLEWVVDDTIETLNNWEQEAKEDNL